MKIPVFLLFITFVQITHSSSASKKIPAIKTIIALSKEQIRLGDSAPNDLILNAHFDPDNEFINREQVIVFLEHQRRFVIGVVERQDTPRPPITHNNELTVAISEQVTVKKAARELGKLTN